MNKVHMFQYSMQLSKDKLLSPRTFSLLIVVLFFFYTRLSPLREFAAMVDYNVTPWIFPFLLSNLSFQLTIAFCGAYFFSDVPYMQYKEMYQMIRCGRRKWAIAHIISILEVSVVLSLTMIVISILLLIPRLSLSFQWGEVINTLAQTNATQSLPFAVSYKLIVAYTPLQATGISILLMTGIFFFLGLLMFAVSLFLSRLYAAVAVTFLTAYAVIIYNMPYYLQKKYSYISPLSWLNLANVTTRVQGMYTLPSYQYICAAFIIFSILLSFIIVGRVRKMDCNWNAED